MIKKEYKKINEGIKPIADYLKSVGKERLKNKSEETLYDIRCNLLQSKEQTEEINNLVKSQTWFPKTIIRIEIFHFIINFVYTILTLNPFIFLSCLIPLGILIGSTVSYLRDCKTIEKLDNINNQIDNINKEIVDIKAYRNENLASEVKKIQKHLENNRFRYEYKEELEREKQAKQSIEHTM